MGILYKELSYRIIGLVFDVFREIGPGYDEFIYHEGLRMKLTEHSLNFHSKPSFKVRYSGIKIAELEPDFIVEEKILLELKAIQTEFLPENYTQIITYLLATKIRLGVLINFGLHKAMFRRILFDQRPLEILENFSEIVQTEVVAHLRKCILNVAKELCLGYHARIYREAMKVELRLNGFEVKDQVCIPVRLQNNFIKNYEIDYWMIDERILLGVLAGSKEIRAYDVMRMRSYLKNLKLNTGLLAFWGKDHLKILGIRRQN